MTNFSAVLGLALATGLFVQGAKEPAGAAALKGEWVVTQLNGEPVPDAPELKLAFEGDKYYQALGGEINERGTIKLDASQKPMTIDLIIAEGDDAGKTQLGIIEASADTIRASLATPGATERPKDFNVRDGVFVLVGKRAPR